MRVICLETPAFRKLLDHVIEHIKEKNNIQEDRWVSGEEARRILKVKSKTTLLKLRQTGAIRYSQPEKKMILYYLPSLYEYLEKYANETF